MTLGRIMRMAGRPEAAMAKGLRAFKKMWRRAARKDARRGTTAVEMALIAPVFFMLIIGITETTMIETAQQLLENAAYNTSRLAKTGFVTNGQTQAQTVSQIMTQELQSFGTFIDMTHVTMTSTSYNSFNNIGSGGTTGMGNPEQIVVYTISYPWKLFTPMIGSLIGTNGAITLTSRIVVRNEPY
jgi:Flp pilus assembly protein TadG